MIVALVAIIVAAGSVVALVFRRITLRQEKQAKQQHGS